MTEYFSPRAKKRWCLSHYDNMGHSALGVSPQAATVCLLNCFVFSVCAGLYSKNVNKTVHRWTFEFANFSYSLYLYLPSLLCNWSYSVITHMI